MELNKIIGDLENVFIQDGDLEVNYTFIGDEVDTSLSLIINQLKEFREINGNVGFLVWIGKDYLVLKL